MNRPRAGLDLDLPDFEPRATREPEPDAEAIKQLAEHAGFTSRHAPAAAPQPAAAPAPAAPAFDARSLRRSNRTAKLNIATTEESRQRFWTLAQRMGSINGEDVLVAMMNALEREIDGRND